MTSPKRGRKYTLTRTRDQDGKRHVVDTVTLRDAQQQVAWCCTDNVGMMRSEASMAASRLTPGEPLSIGGYTFTLS